MYVIGITGTKEFANDETGTFFSQFRSSYAKILSNTSEDFVPVLLPHLVEKIPSYAKMCSGIIFSGGPNDVSAKIYSNCKEDDSLYVDETGRVEFDIELMRTFEGTGKPILGICLGMQIMACIRGCTLNKNIDSITKMPHNKSNSYSDAFSVTHEVKILHGTKLFQILGNDAIKTNSAHHCCVGEVSGEVVISGVARDGVVEAIEVSNHPFMVGLQWHPEAMVKDPYQKKIFEAFLSVAKNGA